MTIVHVYPLRDVEKHVTNKGGAGCRCEPKCLNFGEDQAGRPSRVFIHKPWSKHCKKIVRATYWQ